MLVKYWHAAIFATTIALAVNPARAEEKQTGYVCPVSGPSTATPQPIDIWADIYSALNAWACERPDTCISMCARECKGCKECKECKGCKECKECKGKCCCCCCADKAEKATVAVPIVVVVPSPFASAPGCAVVPHPIAAPSMPACMLPPSAALPPPLPLPPPSCCPCPPGVAPVCYPMMPGRPPEVRDQSCPLGATPVCCPISCPPTATLDTNPGIDSWLSLLSMAAELCCSHTQPPSLPSMCATLLSMAAELCNQNTAADVAMPSGYYLQHPPQYMPPAFPSSRDSAVQEAPYSAVPPPPPPVMPCSIANPAASASSAMEAHLVAKANEGHLEIKAGDDARMICKKMVVKISDCSLTITTVDGKVRVRASDFKAKAACVRTDRKDRLILQGNAVLHYRKDGHRAHVTAEHIELNLATGSVTVESAGKLKLERIGVSFVR